MLDTPVQLIPPSEVTYTESFDAAATTSPPNTSTKLCTLGMGVVLTVQLAPLLVERRMPLLVTARRVPFSMWNRRVADGSEGSTIHERPVSTER